MRMKTTFTRTTTMPRMTRVTSMDRSKVPCVDGRCMFPSETLGRSVDGRCSGAGWLALMVASEKNQRNSNSALRPHDMQGPVHGCSVPCEWLRLPQLPTVARELFTRTCPQWDTCVRPNNSAGSQAHKLHGKNLSLRSDVFKPTASSIQTCRIWGKLWASFWFFEPRENSSCTERHSNPLGRGLSNLHVVPQVASEWGLDRDSETT